MQHYERAGGIKTMEVDHFDPRRKKDLIQDYNNLLLVSSYCNNKKRDIWPTKEELQHGCRFLNPCEEVDYGEQIFEHTESHILVGLTPAAQWHIRTCGLNAPHFVNERRLRARYWAELTATQIHVNAVDLHAVAPLLQSFRAEVEKMIPPIPSPPPV